MLILVSFDAHFRGLVQVRTTFGLSHSGGLNVSQTWWDTRLTQPEILQTCLRNEMILYYNYMAEVKEDIRRLLWQMWYFVLTLHFLN
jgi:hypothetical protein